MYIPVLRAKQGEFKALLNLTPEQKQAVTPLFQILPNSEGKDGYALNQAQKIEDCWPSETGKCYVDFSFFESSRSGFDADLIQEIFVALSSLDVDFIPVIQINSPDIYLDLLNQLSLASGVCLRVTRRSAQARMINQALDQIFSSFGLTPDKLDLLIDFDFVQDDGVPLCVNTIERINQQVNHIETLRSFIICAGSFPSDVSHIQRDSIEFLDRVEWVLWAALEDADIGREVLYGDYLNVHPDFDPESQAFPGSCTIKYSINDKFVIFRGARPGDHRDGNFQYLRKARELVNSSYFLGPDFSWGDQEIHDRANRDDSPGNAGTWVAITENHHIALIVNLLS